MKLELSLLKLVIMRVLQCDYLNAGIFTNLQIIFNIENVEKTLSHLQQNKELTWKNTRKKHSWQPASQVWINYCYFHKKSKIININNKKGAECQIYMEMTETSTCF